MSYANVVSTLALVLAIGGGTAWAAHHYLISSTSQIKPSVLKNLHGANGHNGHNGTNGATGATGVTGATGANLTSQTPLPSGQSESGFYAAAGGSSTGGFIGTGITYVQPLTAAIADGNIIWNKAGSPRSTALDTAVLTADTSACMTARSRASGPASSTQTTDSARRRQERSFTGR
jgi:hypothetical protein